MWWFNYQSLKLVLKLEQLKYIACRKKNGKADFLDYYLLASTFFSK
jgi:hypothetical protein